MTMIETTSIPVRVRIAPSPTGPITLGTARTALFNWLFAKQHNGRFIVRIEDTDRERSKKEYEDQILEGLSWLGLLWDEGPDKGGPYGPYRQSERIPLYQTYLTQLLRNRRAYYCYCTKEELDAERQAILAEGLPPRYSGHCRELTEPPAGQKPQVIRFKTPAAPLEFKDMIRGKVAFDASLFGDIVIAKSLNEPLFNFAVVIDDHEMAISHVIRGEDHISNTPKQLLLMNALGFSPPLYAHIPLILAPNRGKLSKRTAESSFLEYRDKGYLPEALFNFLGLLGWHPKDTQEIFSPDELIRAFNIRRVQKGGAVLDVEKLDWINSQHLRHLSEKELAEHLKPFLRSHALNPKDRLLYKVIGAVKERLETLGQFVELSRFFFALPDYDAKLLVWKDTPVSKIKNVLGRLDELFQNFPSSEIRGDMLREKLTPLIEEEGRGAVLWPLRVALSGQAASPDPVVIAEVLGKDESLKRIKTARTKINEI